MNQSEKISSSLKKWPAILPWMAGAGFALTHIAMTSNCTISKEGRCAMCGSCAIAVGSLVLWAVYKKKREDRLNVEGERAI